MSSEVVRRIRDGSDVVGIEGSLGLAVGVEVGVGAGSFDGAGIEGALGVAVGAEVGVGSGASSDVV